jgi:alpha-beta hydrolase superfamily lysophospholipase
MAQPAPKEFSDIWDGVPIHGFWSEVDQPEAVVVLIHGFGEHSGRYLQQVVPLFNRHRCAVLGFDLPGHGRSGGKRGHCKGYGQLMDLLGHAVQIARKRHPDAPLLLFGHSMGGNLVLNFVLRGHGTPEGLIASSPYLRLAFRPPAWKWNLGKVLQRLAPSITVPAGLDPRGISRDPAEVAAYTADPLIHDRVSPAYSFPVIEAGEWAVANAGSLAVPALILHGGADRIIDPQGSRDFHEKAPHSSLVIIPDGYHELHHDLGRNLYFEAIDTWLEEWGARGRRTAGASK